MNTPTAAQVMAAYYLKGQLYKFVKDHEHLLTKDMEPGDATSARFDLDGQELPLGKIQRTEPKPAWRVTDKDALAEWAETSMPELVETVTVLKEEAVKDLLKRVTTQNAAITEDGEVIPGLSWATSVGSSVRYTPAKDIHRSLSLIAREGRIAEITGGVLGEVEE